MSECAVGKRQEFIVVANHMRINIISVTNPSPISKSCIIIALYLTWIKSIFYSL